MKGQENAVWDKRTEQNISLVHSEGTYCSV